MKFNFHGVTSALVTPFYNGEVDYDSLKKLIDYQLAAGIQGFVINGTTAESPTLTWSEIENIYQIARDKVGTSIPLILGTGSNSTQKTIEMTKKAEKMGADAALVVVPYYNKPPQRGLVAHFSAVAETTKIPLIMYNVPGRTITNMNEATILELSKKSGIAGLKEASGDIQFDRAIKEKLSPEFAFLSGDDGTFIDFLKLGGHGIISVMSNLLTAECVSWIKSVKSGQLAEAENDFKKYLPLINSMYVEANPIPIKWMLKQKNIIRSAEMRLPLVELDSSYHSDLLNKMKERKLL